MFRCARVNAPPARWCCVRTKVVFAEPLLDKATRLRLWYGDNRKLFGAVIKKGAAPQKKDPVVADHGTEELSLGPFRGGKSLKYFDGGKCGVRRRAESLPRTTVALLPVGKSERSVMAPTAVGGALFSRANFGAPSIIVRKLKTFPMLRVQKMDVVDSAASDEPLQGSFDGNVEFSRFPSVTKILDQTMSESARIALEKWKQAKIAEMGVEGFERYNRAQLERGKMFHELLSQHLLSTQGVTSMDPSLEGVWSSVTPLLKNVSSPKAIESQVVHPVLKYKGIIDCIAMYQDKPTLIEWKKSDKAKPTLSATFDNPVQLAAYFGAVSHDVNYKSLNVRDALLVIAHTDGTPADTFHLSADKMREHWSAWLQRLEKFWKSNERVEVDPKAAGADKSKQ